MPTHLVVPNTLEAERIIGMMNKNLPAFLSHMLQEQGLLDEFSKELLQRSCEATMLADMHQCRWDPATCTLTTEDERAHVEKTKAFEGAAWFKDEFGLLGQRACNQKQYATPEALFNLDDASSRKTIHDRHRNTQGDGDIQMDTPPKKARRAMVDLTADTGDSASHTSSSSLEESSSDTGSRSDASSEGGEDSTSAANRG
jgi:hypothetical protein